MATLDELLARCSADDQRRGAQFERICEWYLENDPVYRCELRQVWLWKEWPGRWSDQDTGIDLVAETVEGALWAVQAKAYQKGHHHTKRELDSFVAESAQERFAHKLLLSTAEDLGRKPRRTLESAGVSYLLRAQLSRAEVDWPDSPEELAPRPPEHKTPRPHQKEAVSAVCTGFEHHERGQLIMACGTGKTLAALWIAERLESTRTLAIFPSLSLLAQTLREWTAQSARSFRWLAVCSDETVAKSQDSIISNTSELGFPTTTDPEKVGEFLRGGGPRIVFATYQSSPKIAAAFTDSEGDLSPFDLIVADEAHRCAGPASNSFATVLDSDAIPGARRLFMTATPRFFTGRAARGAETGDSEIASMDDHVKFGPVLHRLSFGDAIKRDLLSDYQVVIVGISDQNVKEYVDLGTMVTRDGEAVEDARTLAAHVALAKAMRKYDLSRVLTFHNRVSRAKDFSQLFPDIVGWMPVEERPTGAIWSRHVSGKMASGKRDALLDGFREIERGGRGILSNARCLAEGVDVPAIDGVAFIEPRRSQIDIVQAVGRAIRLSATKQVGTVVLGVFIDEDDEAVEAIETSAFTHVWQVLRALRDHDEALAEELDSIRREVGRRPGVRLRLPRKIKIAVPQQLVGAGFVEAFEAMLIDQSTASWEFWFGLLMNFVEREGHALVPQRHREGDHRLGGWVSNQRIRYAQGKVPASRVDRLGEVPGWSWDKYADEWETGYRALQTFMQREGHSRPTALHMEGSFRLGMWVSRQRRFRTQGRLSPEREERLLQLDGWAWDGLAAQWEDGFRALMAFVAREGHARVPQNHVEGDIPLWNWITVQRRKYKKGTLESEEIERLESVEGWFWNRYVALWEEGYQMLLSFVEREDHARVPREHLEGKHQLGKWVTRQRSDYKKGKQTEDRVERLESLPGWTWDAFHQRWEEGFQALQRFVAREGHAMVPATHLEGDVKLGRWVSYQRKAHADGKLEPDRESRLKQTSGWAWKG